MAGRSDLGKLQDLLHEQLGDLSVAYGVTSLALFGSWVRGEQTPGSDLDVLVEFREPPSLLRFVQLEHHLCDLLGMKVDLVMKDALKPRIAQRVSQEAVAV